MGIDINYWVVVASAVASLVAGAVWYMLFAKTLGNIRKLSAEEEAQVQKHQQAMFGVGFAMSLLMAFVLYHVVAITGQFYHLSSIASGLMASVWMYLGFVVPVQAAHIIFGNYGHMMKKLKLFAVNTGAQLLSLIAMGLVIGWLK